MCATAPHMNITTPPMMPAKTILMPTSPDEWWAQRASSDAQAQMGFERRAASARRFRYDEQP
jgi:hypothetical protein